MDTLPTGIHPSRMFYDTGTPTTSWHGWCSRCTTIRSTSI
ncbi:hypothetical protein [Burkholderia cepacia]